MPFEFALRARFRLDERVAPPRRRELPAVLLPIAVYWLGTAALTYQLVYATPGEATREPSPASTERAAWRADEPRTDEPRTDEPRTDEPRTDEPRTDEPRAPSLQDVVSLDSFDHDPRESFVAQPSTASPSVTAPRVALPRFEPAPETERSEPAPKAQRSLYEAPPAATGDNVPVSNAAHEPPNDALDTRGALPSCETVAAGGNQELDLLSKQRAPDLPREALARVLDNGSYLTACGVPERTTLDVCVAVQEGSARGVTVITRPTDARLAACVRRAVARLRFPYSPQLDVARTHFDRAR